MNNKEKSELFSFPKQLDKALTEKFGEEIKAESYCDILGDMKFKTNFIAEGELKEKVELFIEAFIAGNVELRNRLETLIKK